MIAKQEKRCREAADPSAGYDQFKTGMLVRRLMSDCQNYSNQQSSMLERALYRMSGGEMNPQGGGGPCPGPSSEPRVVTVMEPTANLPQDAVDYSNYQLLDSTGFKHKQPLLQRMLQAPIGANLGEIASPEAGPYPPPTATYCDLNGDLDNSDTLTANSDDVNDPDDPEDYSRQYSSCNNAMFEENNSNNNNNHQARSYLMMGNQCTFDNNSRGKWIQDPEYVIADTTSGDACMAAPCQQSAETSSRCLPINYYLQNSQNFNYYYNSVAQQHLINQHQRDFYQGQQQQQQQTLTSQQQNDNSLYFAHNRQIPSDNSYQQLEDQQQQQQQLNEAYNYHRSSSGVNYSQQQQHYSNQAANNLEYSQYSSGSSSQQNDTLNANNDCQMPRHTGAYTITVLVKKKKKQTLKIIKYFYCLCRCFRALQSKVAGEELLVAGGESAEPEDEQQQPIVRSQQDGANVECLLLQRTSGDGQAGGLALGVHAEAAILSGESQLQLVVGVVGIRQQREGHATGRQRAAGAE